jgi:hypothetical protein
VKISSLAAEARIIRREERRALRSATWARGDSGAAVQGRETALENAIAEHTSLREHRRLVVRPEARHAQLAAAFLRGRTAYRRIEAAGSRDPDLERVVGNVARFSHTRADAVRASVKAWLETA